FRAALTAWVSPRPFLPSAWAALRASAWTLRRSGVMILSAFLLISSSRGVYSLRSSATLACCFSSSLIALLGNEKTLAYGSRLGASFLSVFLSSAGAGPAKRAARQKAERPRTTVLTALPPGGQRRRHRAPARRAVQGRF